MIHLDYRQYTTTLSLLYPYIATWYTMFAPVQSWEPVGAGPYIDLIVVFYLAKNHPHTAEPADIDSAGGYRS